MDWQMAGTQRWDGDGDEVKGDKSRTHLTLKPIISRDIT